MAKGPQLLASGIILLLVGIGMAVWGVLDLQGDQHGRHVGGGWHIDNHARGRRNCIIGGVGIILGIVFQGMACCKWNEEEVVESESDGSSIMIVSDSQQQHQQSYGAAPQCNPAGHLQGYQQPGYAPQQPGYPQQQPGYAPQQGQSSHYPAGMQQQQPVYA